MCPHHDGLKLCPKVKTPSEKVRYPLGIKGTKKNTFSFVDFPIQTSFIVDVPIKPSI